MGMQVLGGGEARSLKDRVTTRLEPSHLVSDRDLRRLRGLSVTTVEELLGLIASDPEVVSEFLPDADLPQIQADAPMLVRAPVLAQMRRLEDETFGMGARAPSDEDVPDRADPDYVASWIDAAADVATSEEGRPPDADLRACFGPVRDQGLRGTCVAHATCALLECQRNRLLGLDEDLSEQFSYWYAKSNDGQPDVEGTWLEVACPGASTAGVATERRWPYNAMPVPGDEGQGPPPSGAEAEALARLLDAPQEMDGRDVDAIRRALARGRPVAISVPVYNNWYSNPATKALGFIPMPIAHSVLRGGHAMCVVGHGRDPVFAGGTYFMVRNSWGTRWAPESPLGPGYGAIPVMYVERYGWEAWTAA